MAGTPLACFDKIGFYVHGLNTAPDKAKSTATRISSIFGIAVFPILNDGLSDTGCAEKIKERVFGAIGDGSRLICLFAHSYGTKGVCEFYNDLSVCFAKPKILIFGIGDARLVEEDPSHYNFTCVSDGLIRFLQALPILFEGTPRILLNNGCSGHGIIEYLNDATLQWTIRNAIESWGKEEEEGLELLSFAGVEADINPPLRSAKRLFPSIYRSAP